MAEDKYTVTTDNSSGPEEIRIKNKCQCGGTHETKIAGLGPINSYTGEFPSPFQIMNYTPPKGEPIWPQIYVPDKTIRTWIKDAAKYHEIPHEMLAVILQQENAPSASKWRQFLQFGERTATTLAAQIDKKLDIVPDKIADGSSGFMNMRRQTLQDTIKYTKEKYGRNPVSAGILDSGVQGADWRADLYYGAAHIRQLIDRVTGHVCSKGEITLDQVEQVFIRYNGSGKDAKKYGSDAMALLKAAVAGSDTLFFYEK